MSIETQVQATPAAASEVSERKRIRLTAMLPGQAVCQGEFYVQYLGNEERLPVDARYSTYPLSMKERQQLEMIGLRPGADHPHTLHPLEGHDCMRLTPSHPLTALVVRIAEEAPPLEFRHEVHGDYIFTQPGWYAFRLQRAGVLEDADLMVPARD